jgi:ribosomal protein S18 acetylase RimI-like enzyme
MAIIVRTLTVNDGELLKEIFMRMTTESPTSFRATLAELEQRTDAEWQSLARYVAESPSGEGYVAEEHGELCGFVAGNLLTEARLAEIEGRPIQDQGDALTGTATLGSMWVAPDKRSQGIGQMLIQAVLVWAKAKDQRRVILAVTEGNDRALRAYTRANFLPTRYSLDHPSYPGVQINFMEYML